MELHSIGTIHSPFQELSGMPIQPTAALGVQGTVTLFPEFQEGLADLDGFSHIILLYQFHQSSGFHLTVLPFMDKLPRGLFATRAPKRPNPIGLSIVQLEAVVDGVLHIQNVDILDGTPLLDIKPYVPAFDAPGGARSGWLEEAKEDFTVRRSDDRFLSA